MQRSLPRCAARFPAERDRMQTRFFIAATAGHVDHGKSALVCALTGTDPDRLPEEKRRGVTIDLGFAHLDLPAPDDPGTRFHVGIVDVPGHEDFVKNMVAGVGAVDLALLVVAADDGWMPQTEEHLRILEYLSVRRGVVALTKIDLLPAAAQRQVAVEAVRGQLAGSTLAEAPIVPLSTVTGEGLEALRAALTQTLADAPPSPDLGKPRLPIDRVFVVRGAGTVVTGTLSGGSLARGETVILQPGGQTARVRGVQSDHHDVEIGQPGSRVALNLPELSADPAKPGAARRGQVVTLAALGDAGNTVDALLVRVARAGRAGVAEPDLKNGAGVRVHVGSGSHAARVFLRDGSVLPPGERAIAQVRFETPVFVFAGDRFVVRDASSRATLAGGTVLEAGSSRRGWRGAGQRKFLDARAAAAPPDELAIFLTTQLARDGVALRRHLLVQSRFSAAAIDAALERLHARADVFLTPTLAADGAWWAAMRELAVSAIDTFHRRQPNRGGLPVAELQRTLAAAARRPVPPWTGALIADLQTRGFTVHGTVIRRTEHRLELPAHLRAAAARVRGGLVAKPFEPESRAVLAPDAATQSALRFLLETGEAVELTPEVVLSVGGFVRMRAAIIRHLRARGSATASELRQALGTTRRILVPLLERLDREGVTRREGDQRVLTAGE